MALNNNISMLNVLNYINHYLFYYLTRDISMKICLNCKKEFVPRAKDKCCSIKCLIFANHDKNENKCWIWNRKSDRYGKLRWFNKDISAHRASYIEFKGEIPLGLVVCHICDDPKCVNPDHLFISSHGDNLRDAINKKRKLIGTNANGLMFTNEQVNQMRLLKKEGITYRRLSLIFNCSVVYLVKVIKNSIRKDI